MWLKKTLVAMGFLLNLSHAATVTTARGAEGGVGVTAPQPPMAFKKKIFS